MQHLSGDAVDSLWRDARRSAFHLETHDTYNVPAEAEPLRRFLAGEPAEDRSDRPWTRMMLEVTARGVHVSRVRVVTEPLSDYQRWLLSITGVNAAAGEDIRYLPREKAPVRGPDDFWLFDDRTVAFNLVDAEGKPAGLAVTDDPSIAAVCRFARDTLWQAATPYSEYTPEQ
ncbi:hypothetical protein IU449_27405 [Nocardia higoensis]|uniref:DUF6879 domain-containing protein n=1 Tax=Nocardia higoensis TaxID=228599 RepID=A0ABS0DMG2_9NOCA|nr:DUF6879 family protein [Nocardia higoensis]MBF6358229.1 hypothetical protein [Nocardia higoensis]